METNAAIAYRELFSATPLAIAPAAKIYTEPERDVFQKLQDRGLLDVLLLDRTTKKRIIWATDTYSDLGKGFGKKDEIRPDLICGRHDELARIRRERRIERTRKHGEVFTPVPVCKKMCGYVHKSMRGKDWQKYIESTVLEITCGEAPFLAGRCDLGTGAIVPLKERAGILDKKLQAIGGRITDRNEWLEWAFKAYKATYGYEFQGDNLLLARMNLLDTFGEYHKDRWDFWPSDGECGTLLDIVSWNIWQMDGLTGTIPFGTVNRQAALFPDSARESAPCLIRDWNSGKIVTFLSCGSAK